MVVYHLHLHNISCLYLNEYGYSACKCMVTLYHQMCFVLKYLLFSEMKCNDNEIIHMQYCKHTFYM